MADVVKSSLTAQGRWIGALSEFGPTPKVDAFLAEVQDVCRRHGFSIGHEDIGGAFVISRYWNDTDLEWLGAASVDETIPPEEA